MQTRSESTTTADPRALLRILRRRAWVTVSCVVLGAGLAFGVSLAQQKEYTATASLLFSKQNFDQRLFGSAVASFEDPTRQAATNVRLASLESVSTLAARSLGMTPEAVAQAVRIESDGESDVVSINATDAEPDQAAAIANQFGAAFVRFRRGAQRAALEEAQRVVERQLGDTSPTGGDAAARLSLQRRVEQLRVLSSLQTGDVELVQRAEPPTEPSAPKPVRNAALGALVGLLFGVALSLVLARIDRRIRDVSEAEEVYGLPLLGVLRDSRTLSQGEQQPAMLPADDAEAFRLLRARLRYFNVDREIRSVLVSSAAPAEGKSTIAWYLAAAAAAAGADRVIILEADLHRPSLSTRHPVVSSPGLAELLTHGIPLEETIQEISMPERAVSEAKFSVITAGQIPPNPAALLESHAMSALLRELTERYDLVIIDSPPASVVSDAMPLVPQVDGVLIVSRLNRSTRDAAKHLRRDLDALRAPLLGLVVNGVKSGVASGYYGYSYEHGYATTHSAVGSSDSQTQKDKEATLGGDTEKGPVPVPENT